MTADTIILSVIGVFITGILAILGFLIKHWINNMENRFNEFTLVLKDLTGAIVDLRIMRAASEETLKNLSDKTFENSECLGKHDIHIQDHEVRLTVIERKK